MTQSRFQILFNNWEIDFSPGSTVNADHLKICLKGNRQSFSSPKLSLVMDQPLKFHYPSVIVLVEDIIHEQVATVQRSTWELSDLVDMISVW